MQLHRLQQKLDENHPDAADAAGEFKKQIQAFQEHLPLIKCIMSEALQNDDWQEIKAVIDRPELDPQQITVDKFESDNLSKNIQEIEDITTRADKKFQLGKRLK